MIVCVPADIGTGNLPECNVTTSANLLGGKIVPPGGVPPVPFGYGGWVGPSLDAVTNYESFPHWETNHFPALCMQLLYCAKGKAVPVTGREGP
jgi:hypothetical protein